MQNPFASSRRLTSLPAPFVLELRQEDVSPGEHFTPAAAVLVTPSLRESGLLRRLAPEETETLLLVLAGVTANGTFVATPELLAQTLGISAATMLARLRRLCALTWNDSPLLREQSSANGMRFFVPADALLLVRRSVVREPGSAPDGSLTVPREAPLIRGGHREAIIAQNRAAYARPRAEVEAEIEAFLRRGPERELKAGERIADEPVVPLTPEEAQRRDLVLRLVAQGLTPEQGRGLMDLYRPDLIERQLEYLPYRHARNPAGMLVASIEGDYAPPLALRLASAQTTPRPIAGGQGSEGALLREEITESGASPALVAAPEVAGEVEVPWPVEDVPLREVENPGANPLDGEAAPQQNYVLPTPLVEGTGLQSESDA